MLHDFRWAVHWLRRNPLFATAVVAILMAMLTLVALGIGERMETWEQFVWPSALIVWALRVAVNPGE